MDVEPIPRAPLDGALADAAWLRRDELDVFDSVRIDGVFSPMAFAVGDGPLVSWRTTDTYPVDGFHFRDEHPFIPWD